MYNGSYARSEVCVFGISVLLDEKKTFFSGLILMLLERMERAFSEIQSNFLSQLNVGSFRFIFCYLRSSSKSKAGLSLSLSFLLEFIKV